MFPHVHIRFTLHSAKSGQKVIVLAATRVVLECLHAAIGAPEAAESTHNAPLYCIDIPRVDYLLL